MNDVCKDVKLEPALLPVSEEILRAGSNCKDGAKSDVSASGFWIPLNRAFFDIRVFNPMARSNCGKTIPDMYKAQEDGKKREYNARVLEVEKGSFTPLVFSCTGGAGNEASKFLKVLAAKWSKKKGEEYTKAISFIRRRFCFDIIRTCVISFDKESSGKRKDIAASVNDVELVFRDQIPIGLIDSLIFLCF